MISLMDTKIFVNVSNLFYFVIYFLIIIVIFLADYCSRVKRAGHKSTRRNEDPNLP